MKFAETGDIAVAGGMQGRTSYTVAQSSKIMDMLSNKLYSDKPRAVVRELSTNGWDGHIMAGTTGIAPEMHLPSMADPRFYIRDFGTGMSKEDLETMYQTYGVSKKDHSNEFNGCMGIGSKSPFAYTRSFVTISYYNGKKYKFINSKDDMNMPQLLFAGESDTDEPNGLFVEVAVQPQDIQRFIQAAQDVVQWFPVPFKILNCPQFKRTQRSYIREGKGWKIRRDTNTSCAVMGFVEYPIEAKHFSEGANTKDVHWYQYNDRTPVVKLLNLGLELHFDIGEVEMSIAREALEYNATTIKHIKGRLESVLADLKEIAAKEFSGCKNLWDARCKFWEYQQGQMSGVRELLALGGVEYKGFKLDEQYDLKKLPPDVKLTRFTRRYTQKPKREENVHAIHIDKEVRFMTGDMERGNYVAVERWMMDDNHRKEVYLCEFKTPAAKKAFMDYLDIDPSMFVTTSSVPKPPKKARIKQERVFIFDKSVASYSSGRDSQSTYWSDGAVDFKAGGLYVEIKNWHILSGGADKGVAPDLNKIICALEQAGIKVPDIIGVKTAVINKFNASTKWTDFFSWAKVNLEKTIDSKNAAQVLAQAGAYEDELSRDNFYRGLVKNSTEAVAKSDGIFQKTLDILADYRKIYEVELPKIKKIDDVLRALGISAASVSHKDNTLSKMIAELQKKYSFLILIESWQTTDKKKSTEIVKLINLFDTQS